MAEALFNHECKKHPLPQQVKASSAGLSATPGEKASFKARKLLGLEGVRGLETHRASLLNREKIAINDLILVMTDDHRRHLVQQYPQTVGKVFVLKEYVFPKAAEIDIVDPIGKNMEIYQQVMKEIRTCITKLITLLGESTGR